MLVVISPKKYLEELYENIEDVESFKNLNRIEWEARKKGNLIITTIFLDSTR